HLGGAVLSPHVVGGRSELVVLGAGVGDHIHRTRRDAGGVRRVGVHVAARVDVVVAHQHQVDVVALEDGQPLRADDRLVPALRGREDRLVEGHHVPLGRAALQHEVEPGGLELRPQLLALRERAFRSRAGGEVRRREEGLVGGRVQRDEPHVLVVGEVHRLLGELRPVVEERAILARHVGVALRPLRELADGAVVRGVGGVLEVGLPSLQQLVALVLVVAGRRHHVRARRGFLHALEPVDPLGLVAGGVDQVARVHGSDRARRLLLGLLHDRGPGAVEADLCVAVVDELEVGLRRVRRAELVPIAPAAGDPHTVAVGRGGAELGDGGGEVMVRVAVHHARVVGVDRPHGAAVRGADLDLPRGVRRVSGLPGEGLRGRRRLGGGEDHARGRGDDGGAGVGGGDE
ncbi:hypothetical protein ABE10_12500, partial [Bacillus toyonensis]|nr:hypothetical protein [Bacillus toyonensis]